VSGLFMKVSSDFVIDVSQVVAAGAWIKTPSMF
jgi:hypothetical protein